MNIVNFNNVNVDIHSGNIGISVSGGADSAILLYILMKYAQDPVHVFTCSSKEKNRVSPHIALDVIGKCIDLTGKQDVYHHTYFVEKQTYQTWIDGLIKPIINKTVDIMYTGVTALPPDDVLTQFNTKNTLYNKRDPNQIRPVYHKGNFYTPLFNLNKQQVCEIYKELNVLDDLYPLTRSCEDLKLTSGHCGKCWWCEERKWGFGNL
jgi:7-cyano-7-deazaguanine synthase in queuosine biosynthesis